MKFILFVCVLIAVQSTQITIPCAVEIAKLTKALAQLNSDINAGDNIAVAKDIVIVYKEIQTVKEKCSSEEQAQFHEYGINILKCFKETYTISSDSYSLYKEFQQNGLSIDFLQGLESVGLQIDPMIADCAGENAAAHFNEIFPPECIQALEQLGEDAYNIYQDRDKAGKILPNLVKLSKDYAYGKQVCDFLK